jgi:hypothetical protein
VIGADEGPDHGGGLATTVLLGFAAGVLGLLGGLPLYVGPTIGVLGVVASVLLRRSRPERSGTLALLPVLLAIALLAATAPVVPSTELFAGLTGLALLVWVADDPARPAGGGRRAVPVIALGALGVGLAWAITLALPGRSPNVGLAGGLLAAALVLLALLIARLPRLTLGSVRNA